MRGRISALKIEIDSETRKLLQGWLRRQKTPVGLAKRAHEMVLCVDEKTNLQPRPRTAATKPAKPKCPVRVEHEYERQGALNLFAAFDTRTGQVWGQTYQRKRQEEFIDFLEYLEQRLPAHITTIHLVLDNLSVHKGKKVHAWLANHPRFVFHYPPVHCSWMNQIEQWFSILQRKRLRIANFADKTVLAERLQAFIGEWNALAKRGVSPSLIRLIGVASQWQRSWPSANLPNLI